MRDRITLRIPNKDIERWEKLAALEQRSLSNWVRRIVNQATEHNQLPVDKYSDLEPEAQTVYVNGLAITIKADR